MTNRRTIRTFTGWHMTAILVVFFLIVMAVNVTMARLASSTFGGTVVDNSYVASQHYNEWLARAAAQDRLGWRETVTVDTDRHIRLVVRKEGKAIGPVEATALLSHPLGSVPATSIGFVPARDGSLRSLAALPAGRWWLDLEVRHAGDAARYRVSLQ